jgi:hypothetical protein
MIFRLDSISNTMQERQRNEKSGNQKYTITESIRQLLDQLRLARRQMLGIDESPVPFIKLKCFFCGDGACDVTIPHEQSQLREICRYNRGSVGCGHTPYIMHYSCNYSQLLRRFDLDNTATDLIFLDRLEQCAEIAFAKPFITLALDELEENRPDYRL